MVNKDKIKEVIKSVMEENGYEGINRKVVKSLVREFNSRVKFGFELDGERVKKVTAGKTANFWILQFWTEIIKKDKKGFGYAYNLQHPHLSEWGSLYLPT